MITNYSNQLLRINVFICQNDNPNIMQMFYTFIINKFYLFLHMIKEITLNDISIKARSKREVYLVLTVEGGLYLPPILDANRAYLKDIMSG